MARTTPGRIPLAVGLSISLVAHLTALAFVKIDVPDMSSTRLEMVPVVIAERAAPPRPAIQVVEIRPPGMSLPSGGSRGGVRTAAPARTVDPGASVSLVSSTPVPRRSATRGVSTVSLAARVPVVSILTVALATSLEGGPDLDEEATVARRPGRGVVLRGAGVSGGSGAPSRGLAGRGLGTGSGGVTIIGPGGDCITLGSSLPTLLRLPGERPPNGTVARGAPASIGGSGFRPR
ncbi:MAG: hypothetical protein ACC682_04475 [Gemmatimonadota bacterium]